MESTYLGSQRAIDKVKGFYSLDEGWDGYGAEKVSSIAIENAVYFATFLKAMGIDTINGVSPSPDGGVQICVRNKNDNIEVENDFHPDGSVETTAFDLDTLEPVKITDDSDEF